MKVEKSPTFVGIFNFSQNPAKFTWLQFMNLMDLRLHYKIFVNNVENKTTHKWSSLTYLYTFLIFLVHICILRTRVVKRSFFFRMIFCDSCVPYYIMQYWLMLKNTHKCNSLIQHYELLVILIFQEQELWQYIFLQIVSELDIFSNMIIVLLYYWHCKILQTLTLHSESSAGFCESDKKSNICGQFQIFTKSCTIYMALIQIQSQIIPSSIHYTFVSKLQMEIA